MLSGTDLAVATSGVYERAGTCWTRRAPGQWAAFGDSGRHRPRGGRRVRDSCPGHGQPGLGWLNRLDGYTHAVVTDDARQYYSVNLPLTD
ncbi:hypothetical protein NKG94_46335 [Micromonospora sp. M12]